MPRAKNGFLKRTLGIASPRKGWVGGFQAPEGICFLLLQNPHVWEPALEPQEHQFVNSSLVGDFYAICWLSSRVSNG